MDRKNNYQFIMTLVSVACIGLIAESMLMRWEFWVSPLLIMGLVALWMSHIIEKPDIGIREVLLFAFAMFMVFFHGIHETSFFDVFVVASLGLVAFSLMNRIYMINLFLGEFLFLIIFQIFMAIRNSSVVFDSLNISRIILHVISYCVIYFVCFKSVQNRSEIYEVLNNKDRELEASSKDMNDFLSNISHELRTPVNVVNGMSDLSLKQKESREVRAIWEAGLRLTGQIDDIQDYTEVRREETYVEEEDYMSTSLINDVVTSFRMDRSKEDLEMIVDLAVDVPVMMRGDIKKLHKIFRHLISNAVKFTKQGGIFVKMDTEKMEYGVNLCIEITDTGIGMKRKDIAAAAKGIYQANKKRDRSTGGVGLGLSIVYGLVHSMGGFVKIESAGGAGTTVRVTIPQKVVSDKPCLQVSKDFSGEVLFYVKPEKYKVPKLREFYRTMAVNLAYELGISLYSGDTIAEAERLIKNRNIKYIFMGEEEYNEAPEYFDKLSRSDIVVSVSAAEGFKKNEGSHIIVMPKPLYAYPVIKILNEGKDIRSLDIDEINQKPVLTGVKALVVDDEPMNLVVATGLFGEYGMTSDSAGSGAEAIEKYAAGDYDVIFMDHMMPEMDGVEAMKRIKSLAFETGRTVPVVALTANVVSGAREMFKKEGFDGFVGKPINTSEFERVMYQLFPDERTVEGA